MEQQPQNPEGNRWLDAAVNEPLIYLGITDALREDRAIDHATARLIASNLHLGQLPGLRAFSSSGTLSESLQSELDQLRSEAPIEAESWLDAMDEYLAVRDDPRPIARWHELWPTALLSRTPTEQVGSTDEMGWFALFRHEDRPGGFICTNDTLGFRTYVVAYSDDELTKRWAHIYEEYSYFYRLQHGRDKPL